MTVSTREAKSFLRVVEDSFLDLLQGSDDQTVVGGVKNWSSLRILKLQMSSLPIIVTSSIRAFRMCLSQSVNSAI